MITKWTDLKCNIYDMVDFYDFCIFPDVVNHIRGYSDGLVPNQLIIRLRVAVNIQYCSSWRRLEKNRTSEKAGFASFLCFFHSSPSDTTMFRPKKAKEPYISMGLGKRALDEVIS